MGVLFVLSATVGPVAVIFAALWAMNPWRMGPLEWAQWIRAGRPDRTLRRMR